MTYRGAQSVEVGFDLFNACNTTTERGEISRLLMIFALAANNGQVQNQKPIT